MISPVNDSLEETCWLWKEIALRKFTFHSTFVSVYSFSWDTTRTYVCVWESVRLYVCVCFCVCVCVSVWETKKKERQERERERERESVCVCVCVYGWSKSYKSSMKIFTRPLFKFVLSSLHLFKVVIFCWDKIRPVLLPKRFSFKTHHAPFWFWMVFLSGFKIETFQLELKFIKVPKIQIQWVGPIGGETNV